MQRTNTSSRWFGGACQAVLFLFLALSVPSCASRTSDPATTTAVRLSLQPIPAYAPLWVAKRRGWLEEVFQEKHLGKVKWFVMRDGPLQNEALAAGLIDMALMADTPALIGRSVGLRTRLIGLAATSPQSLAILVPKDSPTATMRDLRGKKIAVTKGSFCHHLLALALAREGMTIADIQFLNMPGPEINTSLQSGEIAAGVTWEPYISQLLATGTARVLMDGSGLKKGHELIVATSDLVERRPEVARLVLEAYARGGAFIREHPEEAAKLIAEDVNLTSEQILATFSNLNFSPPILPEDIQELDSTQRFLHELGVNKRVVDITAFVDTGFQPLKEGAAK
jgi:sulfonate transport system substrate-binding protein